MESTGHFEVGSWNVSLIRPVVSHNGKIYVFNGNNPRFNSTGNPDGNLSDYWTIEVLNGGRIVQAYKGDTGWSASTRNIDLVYTLRDHDGLVALGTVGYLRSSVGTAIRQRDCWMLETNSH